MKAKFSLATEIDIISKTVPRPDDVYDREQYAIVRKYWDLITVLKKYGIPIGVDEYTLERDKH